jgi:hypothetical protein
MADKPKKWSPPPFPDNVHVIAISEQLEGEELHWHIYLFNEGDEALQNVLITASGYGELNGEDVKTSLLRYSLGELSGYTAKRVEPISTEVMGLYSQYWVSFYKEGKIYDKKFVFPPYSVSHALAKAIPALGIDGVYAE